MTFLLIHSSTELSLKCKQTQLEKTLIQIKGSNKSTHL